MQIALWVAFYILGVFLARLYNIYAVKSGLERRMYPSCWVCSWIMIVIILAYYGYVETRQWRLMKWFMGDNIKRK